LLGFRARGFPASPAVPVSLLDGKEEAVGSSPTEGFKGPANQLVTLPKGAIDPLSQTEGVIVLRA